MKVLVVGPGALGCLLAAKLSKCSEVWLLDHNPARALLLDTAGLTLDEGGRQTQYFVRATADAAAVGKVDLALLCVKSAKVEAAVGVAWPALRQASLFVALQNGLSHLEVLSRVSRSVCWGVGVTGQGATLAGPGHVLHRGAGATWIGLPPPQLVNDQTDRPFCRQALYGAAAVLSEAGVPTEAVADIIPRLWDKLLVNVGINALTAINDCHNGALLDDPLIVEMMVAAVGEGGEVAKKLGIELGTDPVASVTAVCRATAGNISSMLQDVRAGRLTEVEAINGEVVRLAARFGIPVPVNEALVAKVRELERNYHVFS